MLFLPGGMTGKLSSFTCLLHPPAPRVLLPGSLPPASLGSAGVHVADGTLFLFRGVKWRFPGCHVSAQTRGPTRCSHL